jgi:tetratricopeptide (TPR) repeat protein
VATVSEIPAPEKSWDRRDWLCALFLVAATFAAYQPALHSGFIWDDDAHVTRPDLRSLHGLWRIWFDPGATQQYYPVLYTAFWLEHRLWGDAATAYHLLNVAFHATAAFLLFRVLRRVAVPGACLAASIFALHPVCVESVAWVSEQKNTLSAVFYFLAALAYLRFERERRPGTYLVGAVLFALALMSKSVTATLPAALLVVLWWKRGSLSLKHEFLPLAPWLALGAGSGWMTTWMERAHVGASGEPFELGVVARFLVAGRALWFYLEKILWPAGLTFIYPRWTVDTSNPYQYLFPICAAAAVAALWLVRAHSRAPLAAALLFAGTLFPALGFVDVFPFLYSFVADHFQYLAAAMVVSAVAAAITLAKVSLKPAARMSITLASAALVAVLATLTWKQCAMYSDVETLWRTTIERNPSCWMAYNNLASELVKGGRLDEAMADVRASLSIDPANAAAHATLGEVLWKEGRANEAFAQYGKALEIEPGNIAARVDLGSGLLQSGRVDDAILQFQEALRTKPDSGEAHAGLGDAFLRTRRLDEAIPQYYLALEYNPADESAHANLGTALAQKGRTQEAIDQFQEALKTDPRFAAAQFNLGNILLQAGRVGPAIDHYMKAIEIAPDFGMAQANLGFALMQMGRTEEAIAHLQRAVELEPGNANAKRDLADAFARKRQAN